ncbi:unnamed protein product [Nesidiocoris tenuis]|uniref:Uncharacterized protein n=1 Tax=Nesidiocoris tenuis TaxID=355587 RepID=A0A6H5HF84_9HEMI|nr:unnamed protein product [Nesidiocoris tenuis]
MPVLWHQALLTFVQRYKSDISSEQKESLLRLLRYQSHPKVTGDIRRELQNAQPRDLEVVEPVTMAVEQQDCTSTQLFMRRSVFHSLSVGTGRATITPYRKTRMYCVSIADASFNMGEDGAKAGGKSSDDLSRKNSAQYSDDHDGDCGDCLVNLSKVCIPTSDSSPRLNVWTALEQAAARRTKKRNDAKSTMAKQPAEAQKSSSYRPPTDP